MADLIRTIENLTLGEALDYTRQPATMKGPMAIEKSSKEITTGPA
jgi:hypothetical protein